MNNKDKQLAQLLCFVALLASVQAQAATEYLRFEGFITSSAIALAIAGYDDVFDPSQPVYFDVMIDTGLNPPGYADSMYHDVFQSTLVGGTVGTYQMQYGTVGRTVEYFYSEIALNGDFYVVGPSVNCDTGDLPPVCFDQPPLNFDFTWEVGNELEFWTYGDWNNGVPPRNIGSLVVTYRGSTRPVPLPGALLLFVSAFSALRWVRANGAN